MHLKSLTLLNFRSWQNQKFGFHPQTTVIIGPNASGKTNILEAIWFLISGTSFRAEKTSEVIRWQENQTQIKAIVEDEGTKEIGLTLIWENKKRVKKSFLLNKQPQTRKNFLENLHGVVFRPEDIRLIAGSPSSRRQFLDQLLFGLDWQYFQAWHHYFKALKQRNRLLYQLRQKGNSFALKPANFSEFYYWDQSLIKNSAILIEKRRNLIESLNLFLTKEDFKSFAGIELDYQPCPISPQLLKKTFRQDLNQGFTSLGPQKDDFRFLARCFPSLTNDLAAFGSRGQQRLAVFALKLAEMEFVFQQTKKLPLILLDDIFSELDRANHQLLLKLKLENQIILTTTHQALAVDYQKTIVLPGKI